MATSEVKKGDTLNNAELRAAPSDVMATSINHEPPLRPRIPPSIEYTKEFLDGILTGVLRGLRKKIKKRRTPTEVIRIAFAVKVEKYRRLIANPNMVIAQEQAARRA